MEKRYHVAVYHHFENGFDDRFEYSTIKEAEKAARGYVNGKMEPDGFHYDGAAVYDQHKNRCVRIFGDYPDERAQAQVLGLPFPKKGDSIEYVVVFHDHEGLQEEYYYRTSDHAREHLDLFRDVENASIYSRIDLISYNFSTKEKTILESIEF
jgi:CRISPR/Cas system-associated endonuclease Cas3-HD